MGEIGVIVGRFQVPELHDSHVELIKNVVNIHCSNIIIFIGVSPVSPSKRNPLDFIIRKDLFRHFTSIAIIPIMDQYDDDTWSIDLDNKILEVIGKNSAILYGGRDSFLKSYSGMFKTKRFNLKSKISGSSIRKKIAYTEYSSPDFASGIIYAMNKKFPVSYATVDIAIMKKNMVLMGRKSNEDQYRFIGGFTDPTDKCYEHAAKREVMEETGVEVDEFEYVCSTNIDDWRYKKEPDKIKTILFRAKYIFGAPTPGDDIIECKWIGLDKENTNNIMPSHRVLWKKLLKKEKVK